MIVITLILLLKRIMHRYDANYVAIKSVTKYVAICRYEN